MATMVEAGTSSGNTTPELYEAIVPVQAEMIDDLAPVIEYFLREQFASWERYHTLEGMFHLLHRGMLQAWLLQEGDHYVGMALTSMHEYTDVKSVKLEFMSKNGVRKFTQFGTKFEELCRNSGFGVIEAVAHPALARLACNKHGYTCTGVLIVKDLRVQRRN